jgi:MFS family permease
VLVVRVAAPGDRHRATVAVATVTGKNLRPRLGADFARLWTANAISNLGDGAAGVAAPLLVASLTDSPALVAGAVFVQQLPWLLFSLPAGAYVDRLERRRLLVGVNLARGALLAGLAVMVWGGVATIPVLYLAFLLFGTAETIADSTSVALLPSIVPPDGLARANARLLGTYLVGNQLIAPPFGAWLFVVAPALPFALDAASFLAAALLVAPLLWRHPPAPQAVRRRTLRAEIGEGLRWLWHHRTLRLLAVCVGVMNLAGAGSFAIWVLWARERVGLDGVGFATLVLFGAHATIWGVVSVSLRQRIVPDQLRGRVNSVYFLFDLGGAALGTLLGGGLAAILGITAPFLLGSGAVALLTLAAWPRLTPDVLASPDDRP